MSHQFELTSGEGGIGAHGVQERVAAAVPAERYHGSDGDGQHEAGQEHPARLRPFRADRPLRPRSGDEQTAGETSNVGLPGNVRYEEREGQVDAEQHQQLIESSPSLRRATHAPAHVEPGAEETEDRSGGADGDHRGVTQEERRGAAGCCRSDVHAGERDGADLPFESRPEQVERVHVEGDVQYRSLRVEKRMAGHSPHLSGADREVVVLQIAEEPHTRVPRDERDQMNRDCGDDRPLDERGTVQAGGPSGAPASVDDPVAAGDPGMLRAFLADGGVVRALDADRPPALAAGEAGRAVGVPVTDRRCHGFVHGGKLMFRAPYQADGG
jgi:hypothetical protein